MIDSIKTVTREVKTKQYTESDIDHELAVSRETPRDCVTLNQALVNSC